MLVLTRKANQAVVIADAVEVSVLAVVGDKVRIGIEAPRSVPVYRKEVWLEIQRERRARASASPQGTGTARTAAQVGEAARAGGPAGSGDLASRRSVESRAVLAVPPSD